MRRDLRNPLVGAVGVLAVVGTAMWASQSPTLIQACARSPTAVPNASPPAIPASSLDGILSGQLLVAHDRAGDASIVDLATGATTAVPVGFTDPHEVAISPNGRWDIMSDFGRRAGRAPYYDFQGNRVAVIDMAAIRLARVIDLGAHRGAHDVAF